MDKVPNHLRPESLRQAAENLKVLLAEANGMCGDLRRLIKEAKEATTINVEEAVDEKVNDLVREHIEALGKETAKAIEDTTQAIFKRFDDLTETMLGTRTRDMPPIDEIIRVQAWQEEMRRKQQ